MRRTGRRPISALEAELREAFFLDVWDLDGGRCRVTGRRAGQFSPLLQRHHVIEKGRLRARGYPLDVLWDPRNGMLVDVRVHERHTCAFARIPLHAVPERAFVFARELGLEHWILDGVTYQQEVAG